MNESERVRIKSTRDTAIQLAEDHSAQRDTEMKTLFDAADSEKLLGNVRSGSLLGL